MPAMGRKSPVVRRKALTGQVRPEADRLRNARESLFESHSPTLHFSQKAEVEANADAVPSIRNGKISESRLVLSLDLRAHQLGKSNSK